MARDWEAEFKDLNERERAAFRKLGEALYKVRANTPIAVIDEMEQAHAEWQSAKQAMIALMEDFGSQETEPGRF